MLRAAAKSISLIPFEVVFAWRLNCSTVANLRIENSDDDFCVMGRAVIVYVLEFSVEGILNPIVLFVRWGVRIVRILP